MPPSRPAIQLNADIIDQIPTKPLEDVALLTPVHESERKQTWPYSDRCIPSTCTGTCFLVYIHVCKLQVLVCSSSLSSSSPKPSSVSQTIGSPRSTRKNTEATTEADDQNQIDLQVTFNQWFTGSRTLVIDISPQLLFCNRLDLNLWVIADGQPHWKLPARHTWAPTPFHVR